MPEWYSNLVPTNHNSESASLRQNVLGGLRFLFYDVLNRKKIRLMFTAGALCRMAGDLSLRHIYAFACCILCTHHLDFSCYLIMQWLLRGRGFSYNLRNSLVINFKRIIDKLKSVAHRDVTPRPLVKITASKNRCASIYNVNPSKELLYSGYGVEF
jgi:hypothetical protein